eukprot:8113681-Ditylum_brightwellii.AAC.1
MQCNRQMRTCTHSQVTLLKSLPPLELGCQEVIIQFTMVETMIDPLTKYKALCITGSSPCNHYVPRNFCYITSGASH